MTSTARSNSEQYNGKVMGVGNSKVIQLDAGAYSDFPDFWEFLLPMARIFTSKEIKGNSINVRAKPEKII